MEDESLDSPRSPIAVLIMSSEGGDSSISPADKTAAAISLESRDDVAKIALFLEGFTNHKKHHRIQTLVPPKEVGFSTKVSFLCTKIMVFLICFTNHKSEWLKESLPYESIKTEQTPIARFVTIKTMSMPTVPEA